MMTEEESTIQIGMMAAADSLYFGFGWFADAGVGSGLLLPLRMSVEMSTSDLAPPLRKWAVVLSVSMGRPPFSKNFSVDICAGETGEEGEKDEERGEEKGDKVKREEEQGNEGRNTQRSGRQTRM